MAELYTFAKALAQPYLWLLVLGAWYCWRRRSNTDVRVPRTLQLIWLTLIVLSVPATSMVIYRTLEYPYLDIPVPTTGEVDAIVVLGGGSDPPNKTRSYAVVSSGSFERCLRAADLFEDHPCTMILAGGATDAKIDPTTEAETMKRALLALGIPGDKIVLENRSLDTSQNAKYVTEYLKANGLERVVLITHANHMPRSIACFRKCNQDVLPVPCSFGSIGFDGEWFEMLIPSPGGLSGSHKGIREWIGLAYYRISGKI